jgi:hypothetical protein
MKNIIVQLNGIFYLAVDNDLIVRSPVRGRHRPVCRKTEKPSWTAEQVRKILESVPSCSRFGNWEQKFGKLRNETENPERFQLTHFQSLAADRLEGFW